MELLEIKKVKVGPKEFPIFITNRAMIEYEVLSGGSILKMETHEQLLMFFYCTAKAGAKKSGLTFNQTYEQFLDIIDDYYTDTITNFTQAIRGKDSKKK